MSGTTSHDDATLLSQLVQGEVKAFDAIYNSYADDLLHYAYNRTGNKEDSRELVQDLFLKLWENRERLANIRVLRHYLFNAIRYKVIRRYQEKDLLERYAAQYTLTASRFNNSNEEMQNLRDTEALVEQAVSSMPDRMQEAFRLSREENLSIDSIATRMNVSPRAVENYITEALKRLRTSLGEVMALAIWINY